MSQATKRILGVDPGLSFSGFGIVELTGNRLIHIESGSITPDPSLKLQDKIRHNFDKITEIIERIHPDELALESIFYARNVKMAIELAHIRGALILACRLKNIPAYEYSALEIKQAVCGYGNAQKQQVNKMVKLLLKVPQLKDSHAADALAAAICHANTSTLSSKIRDLMT